jgi:hypothetical protein
VHTSGAPRSSCRHRGSRAAVRHLGEPEQRQPRVEAAERAIALLGTVGDSRTLARAEVEFNTGDAHRALELVLQVNGRPGLSTGVEAAALINTAAYLFALEDAAGAQAVAGAALSILRRAHLHQHLAACAILQLAAALALQGDARRAARLLGFADAWTLRESCEWGTAEAKSYETLVAALRVQLTADDIAELTAAGAQLNDDQALDEALAANAS